MRVTTAVQAQVLNTDVRHFCLLTVRLTVSLIVIVKIKVVLIATEIATGSGYKEKKIEEN